MVTILDMQLIKSIQKNPCSNMHNMQTFAASVKSINYRC